MATHRRSENRPPIEQDPSTPIQEDDKDILEEAGAERDEDGGYHVSEDKIRELGAVDTESVRINRRNADLVNKKKANVKNVSINTGDVLESYDLLLASWPANSIDIHVKRLTGTPAQDVLTSRPKNGTELLAVLKAFHGQHEEAQYDVRFKDIGTHQFRGNGRITIRDGRLPQQGQPMQYPPPGYPPGYPMPQPYMQQIYPPPQQAVPNGQPPNGSSNGHLPQQPPQVFVNPPAGPDPMAMFKQMFEMIQSMVPAQHQPAQPVWVPPPTTFVPPPVPTNPDPASMMAWFKQMFEMVQAAQPAQPPGYQPPPTPQTPPAAANLPTRAAPPGMFWEWMPDYNTFALREAVQNPMLQRSGPGGGQRPAYYPNQGQQDPNGRPPYVPQDRQPQRPQSPAEQFRAAMSVMKEARNAFDEMDSLFPGRHDGNERFHEQQENDEHSPVRVDEVGRIKIVRDNDEQGSMRVWESILGNLPEAVKWTADTVEKINKERERRAQPQQLPEGYVEVGPGFRPPPGYKAVIVEDVPQQQQQEEHLPPPPSQVPPPIQSPPSPVVRWPIPEGES